VSIDRPIDFVGYIVPYRGGASAKCVGEQSEKLWNLRL